MVGMIFARKIIHLATKIFGSTNFIRLRNCSSRTNRSWIPWKFFFLHFFFLSWLAM